MGIKSRLEGKEFSSIGPFADALEAGIREEITKELEQIKNELEALKEQVASIAAAQQTTTE